MIIWFQHVEVLKLLEELEKEAGVDRHELSV